jgi:hypothetical protein
VSGALSKIATFANDGTQVGIVRGSIPLSVNKLNPLGRVPKMLFKLEVLHSGKIGHSWKIAATDDGSKITRALTVEGKIRRLARLLQEGIRTIAGTSKE